MALSVVEQYNYTADATVGAHANLGTVSNGIIRARRNGPKVTGNGADGMSGVFKTVNGSPGAYHEWTVNPDGGSALVYDLFVRAWKVNVDLDGYAIFLGGFTQVYFFYAYDTGTSRNRLKLSDASYFATSTVWGPDYAALPYEWINLRIAINKISLYHYDVVYMSRQNQSDPWDTLLTFTNQNMYENTTAFAGNNNNASTAQFAGRLFATVCSGNWADRYDNVPGLTWPENETDWYVDPVDGSDSNDGAEATPWQTWSKLMAEEGYGTFQACNPADRYIYTSDDSSLDWAAQSQAKTGDQYFSGLIRRRGDRISIVPASDNSEYIVDRSLEFRTPGITVKSTIVGTRPKLVHAQPIPASQWVLDGGGLTYVNTTASNINVCCWQDRRILTPVTAANSSAALALTDATEGTFWVSDVNGDIYIRPLKDVDLTTAPDGTIETSLITGGSATLMVMNGDDQGVEWLDLGYTTLAWGTDAVGGYCVGFGAGGLKTLCNCNIHDGGKHLMGNVGNGFAYSDMIVMGNFCQGGPGFSGPGGFTIDVDYCDQPADNPNVGNRVYKRNNVTIGNTTIAGTGKYTKDPNYPQYTTHSSGLGTVFPFTSYIFVNENYENSGACEIPEHPESTGKYKNCKLSYMQLGNNSTATSCTFRNCGQLGGTYDYCLAQFEETANTSSYSTFRWSDGFVTRITNSVLDLTSTRTASVWYHVFGHGWEVTISNSTIFLPPGVSLIQDASSVDLLLCKRVRWVLGDGASHAILKSYDDGATTANRTLAQMKTLGLDVGGIYVDPKSTSVDVEWSNLIKYNKKFAFFG